MNQSVFDSRISHKGQNRTILFYTRVVYAVRAVLHPVARHPLMSRAASALGGHRSDHVIRAEVHEYVLADVALCRVPGA